MVGSFFSLPKKCYTALSTTIFHTVLAELPPDTPGHAIGLWAAQHNNGTVLGQVEVDAKSAAAVL